MDEEKKDAEEMKDAEEEAEEPSEDEQEGGDETSDEEEEKPARPKFELAAKPGEKEEQEKAEPAKAQANEELLKTRERMLRIAADFENYRKRAKKDLDDARHKAQVDILKEMLPIFDNLARAVEHGSGVDDAEPVIQGAKMVTKQFEENLAKFGLKRIESIGKTFDPTIHDAISQEESDEAAPGTIIKEFLAGYMLGDRLLRASMVVVAKPGSGSGSAKADEEEED
jgi:molecular chaperone GrpE